MIGRIPILDVAPTITVDTASGPAPRPAKAVTGEPFEVSATVFREGHDAIGANVVLRDPSGHSAPFTPMRELAPGTDRWGATVIATAEGDWTFTVEAWSDPIASWRHAAEIKIPNAVSGGPGGDVADAELTLEEGAQLLERAAQNVPKEDGRPHLLAAAAGMRNRSDSLAARLDAALDPRVSGILARHPLRELVTATAPKPLRVDRPRALFGSWYELFPRSEGATLDPPRSGTFRSAAERLPAVAAMGFDVVYLPPIHPIGQSYRKGPNNTLSAGPSDVGSPWAIGSPEGGHDAVHPDLGTIEDFDAFVARARGLRLEVALDFALQCSPDHPWVEKHPEWFRHRADGSIAYAENPPKKYQDIYPLDFDRDMDGLVEESLRVLRHWMAHGVRIFRVDNPHTKPVVFWERVLGEIARTDPDVVFLAEAFTRPAMMRTLAKVGFHQSYTYFTWRNDREELTEYLSELAYETAAYMRPNLFVNTPDILHAYLQHGGRPAFAVRAVLAATMAPSWGVYAGYELFENAPVRPGSEEYLDSEKYQLRPRDWGAYEGPEAEGRTLAPLLASLNRLRRTHPALQELRNIRFHHPDNGQIIAYSKRSERGTFLETPADPVAAAAPAGDTVLVVVNLDPRHTQETTLTLDMPALGLAEDDRLTARDELTGAVYDWGRQNYVRLDPTQQSAHILTVRRAPK
ncbi:alpha-1,4-glucan--maltose-1-phosphate maltosyltransferase [Phaeacidiphilus oryzae]|uniref:alpha-1,4-glucan--maltose-1-phosphate maltosyltransferase n=1 Tax=Phaeacidiphilus oryzae TaxID=348818 RepID=UPI000A04965A|nr:alpha-1,4-glucan--maltose-1-phosphate maltosyltransferase [Phaeacidiphilus oryzae]